MEPERKDLRDTRDTRDSHTYIERKERSGGGTAMGFIVGGLVVAVAIIALVFWGGDFTGGGVDGDIEISTQDQVPDAPVENNVEINTDSGGSGAAAPVEATPEQPAETEAQPVAPAQN